MNQFVLNQKQAEKLSPLEMIAAWKLTSARKKHVRKFSLAIRIILMIFFAAYEIVSTGECPET